MKYRLLDIVKCPDCGHFPLNLDVIEAEDTRDEARVGGAPACSVYCGERARPVAPPEGGGGDCESCYRKEVREGLLRCGECGRGYPVYRSVPRLLPHYLLRHFISGKDVGTALSASDIDTGGREIGRFERDVVVTMLGYSFQLTKLREPAPQYEEWEKYFNEHSALPASEYAGRVHLDVGCGAGRFIYWAARHGAECVGIDLSAGVDTSYSFARSTARAHFIQADIFNPPLRDAAFDIISSIGVLHHTPAPRDAFLKAVPLLKPGGRIFIWVYALREMSLAYRASHAVPVRWLTNRLGLTAKFAISCMLTLLLEVFLYWPLRLAALLPGVAGKLGRVPVARNYNLSFVSKVRTVHDRIQPKVAKFITREELEEWYSAAGLEDVGISLREPGGWLATGEKAK